MVVENESTTAECEGEKINEVKRRRQRIKRDDEVSEYGIQEMVEM